MRAKSGSVWRKSAKQERERMIRLPRLGCPVRWLHPRRDVDRSDAALPPLLVPGERLSIPRKAQHRHLRRGEAGSWPKAHLSPPRWPPCGDRANKLYVAPDGAAFDATAKALVRGALIWLRMATAQTACS